MMTIDIFFVLIKALAVGWFFTHFKPIVTAVTTLRNLIPAQLHILIDPLSCWKCFTWWVTLAMTNGDFIQACIASLIAYILDRWLNSLKIYL